MSYAEIASLSFDSGGLSTTCFTFVAAAAAVGAVLGTPLTLGYNLIKKSGLAKNLKVHFGQKTKSKIPTEMPIP